MTQLSSLEIGGKSYTLHKYLIPSLTSSKRGRWGSDTRYQTPVQRIYNYSGLPSRR